MQLKIIIRNSIKKLIALKVWFYKILQIKKLRMKKDTENLNNPTNK